MNTERSDFDLAALRSALARRVAIPTESQDDASRPALVRYLTDEIAPALTRLGFACTLWNNPVPGAPPFLFGARIEDSSLPTVLMYGHGDVVRGYDEQWQAAKSPWTLEVRGDRWYGRGTADNKGQHSINLAALEHVLARRGRRG